MDKKNGNSSRMGVPDENGAKQTDAPMDLHMKIGEFSDCLGLNASQVRYYEKEGILQKEQNLEFSADNVFNEWMEGQHWMIPNAALLSKYLHMTGETIDWLCDNGFVFGSITSFDGTAETDVHWYEEPAGNGAFGVAGKTFFEGLVKDVDTVILSQSQADALAAEGTAALGLTEPAVNIPFLGHATDPAQPLANIQAVLDAAVEQGIACRGESAEELAEAAGMDPATFAATIDAYNAACEAGEDTAFGKAAQFMAAPGEGPYYAIKACAVPYNTMGGLLVNENCQVVDENYKAIDGLYCVGMDSMGTILDDIGYPDFGGPATSWSLNSGRIAAMDAVAELEG